MLRGTEVYPWFLWFVLPWFLNSIFGFRKFKISLPQKFVLSQEELLFGPCPNATVLTGLACFSDHAPTVIEVGNVGYSSHSRFCQCVPKNASFQKCGPNSRKMLLFRVVGLCKCFCFQLFFWLIYVLRWPAWSSYTYFITVAILAQGKPSGYSTTLAVLLNRFMGLGMSLRR